MNNMNIKLQNKTLQQTCIHRKKQNFQQLKKWDQLRAQKMILHRIVSQQIDQNLQNKLKQSNDYLKIFKRFLLETLQQKQAYQSFIITDPSTKLKHNLIGNNVHMTTSRALHKLYNQTQNQHLSKSLKKVLEKGVYDIQNLLQQGNKQIMDIRTRLELIILQIQNCNMSTAQACQKLMNLYNKDKSNKPFKAQIDFLSIQQQFMNQAIKQINTQKCLGLKTIQYIKWMEKFQQQKVALVKNTLKNLMKNQNFNKEKYQSLHIVIQKSTQSQYINIYYSVQDLIQRQNLIKISNIMGKHDRYKIQKQTVLDFLNNLNFEAFNNHNLVLKQYKVFCKIQGQLQQAIIIITVDGFLNLTGGHNTTNIQELSQYQFDYSLKIDSSLMIKLQGDINIVITSKKKNFINFIGLNVGNGNNSKEEIQIVFANQDMRVQFCQFVQKIAKIN